MGTHEIIAIVFYSAKFPTPSFISSSCLSSFVCIFFKILSPPHPRPRFVRGRVGTKNRALNCLMIRMLMDINDWTYAIT